MVSDAVEKSTVETIFIFYLPFVFVVSIGRGRRE
jgi:hypothetical protein